MSSLARAIGIESEVRVVHFMVDQVRAERLRQSWAAFGVEKLSLEVIETMTTTTGGSCAAAMRNTMPTTNMPTR